MFSVTYFKILFYLRIYVINFSSNFYNKDLPNRNGTIDTVEETPDRELRPMASSVAIANDGSRKENPEQASITPSTTPSKTPTSSRASSVVTDGCRKENPVQASFTPSTTHRKKRTYSKGQQNSMEDELKTLSKIPKSPAAKKQKTSQLKNLILPYNQRPAGHPRKMNESEFARYSLVPKPFSQKTEFEKQTSEFGAAVYCLLCYLSYY